MRIEAVMPQVACRWEELVTVVGMVMRSWQDPAQADILLV